MHVIQVIGPIDKRPIVYPLLKVADVLGRTCLITDDTHFLNFSEDFSSDFSINRSDVFIRQSITSDLKELQSTLGISFSGYDYVIISMMNTVVVDGDTFYGDQLVYAHGNRGAMSSKTTFEVINTANFNEVVISTNKAPKNHPKDVPYYVIDTKLYQYVWNCEEENRLIPTSGGLCSFAGKLFSNGLGITEAQFNEQGAREV